MNSATKMLCFLWCQKHRAYLRLSPSTCDSRTAVASPRPKLPALRSHYPCSNKQWQHQQHHYLSPWPNKILRPNNLLHTR
eukprot:2121092-Amphidinium_carterae.1